MSPVNHFDPSPNIIDPEYYAKYGCPHRDWADLRAKEPVSFCDFRDFPAFWALTKHQDILEVSKQPETYLNEPLIAIVRERDRSPEQPLRHLLTMDNPDHRLYRQLIAASFTRRAVQSKHSAYEALADQILDRLRDRDEIDFVTDVAAVLPIWIIADLLGIPEADREQFFHWTNQLIGANDPEFRIEGKDAVETSAHSISEQMAYFEAMVAERRKRPTDDLTSELANARLEGEPIPPYELFSYLVLLVVAGNETTRNAASSGMLALMEHPRQRARLQRHTSDLIDPTVEEIVRWSSPVNQFCRTPNRDVEIRGKTIRAGEHLCLFFASANRDEDVFEDPFVFRIDRQPNPHLGFGIGEHVCLGAHLARLELKALFSRLMARLQAIEPTGPTNRLQSSFIAGIKHLPVSLELSA